ncbi:MAG: OmpA family protein, partial [bacterium]
RRRSSWVLQKSAKAIPVTLKSTGRHTKFLERPGSGGPTLVKSPSTWLRGGRFGAPRMNRLLLVPLVLVMACEGCKKKVETGFALPEPPAPVEEAPKKEVPAPVAEMARNFNRVFFDFDSASLSADGKSALDANAAIMKDYSDIKLEVQGHADERGTT